MDRRPTRRRRQLFRHQAVGAAAEEGADLDELVRIGEKVNSVTRTMGLALTACTPPPAKGEPLFELGDDEIEIGVGIHGEPGRRRANIVPSDELVDILLEPVVADLPFESGDRVALMINGLGGTPISELYVATATRMKPSRRAASRSSRATWGSTARRSTWPVPRSPS